MESKGLLHTDLRRFYDRINDEDDYYPKKKDLFRFCYLEYEDYKKKILSWTLDGYM